MANVKSPIVGAAPGCRGPLLLLQVRDHVYTSAHWTVNGAADSVWAKTTVRTRNDVASRRFVTKWPDKLSSCEDRRQVQPALVYCDDNDDDDAR